MKISDLTEQALNEAVELIRAKYGSDLQAFFADFRRMQESKSSVPAQGSIFSPRARFRCVLLPAPPMIGTTQPAAVQSFLPTIEAARAWAKTVLESASDQNSAVCIYRQEEILTETVRRDDPR